jgi:hypothetical protein
VEDILWTDDDYRAVFQEAALVPVAVHRPLATAADPGPWVSETSIPPWVIYVLARDAARRVP